MMIKKLSQGDVYDIAEDATAAILDYLEPVNVYNIKKKNYVNPENANQELVRIVEDEIGHHIDMLRIDCPDNECSQRLESMLTTAVEGIPMVINAMKNYEEKQAAKLKGKSLVTYLASIFTPTLIGLGGGAAVGFPATGGTLGLMIGIVACLVYDNKQNKEHLQLFDRETMIYCDALEEAYNSPL